MQRIFFGFLFIFLDFNFDLGNRTIGIVPDFVGFILIAMGLFSLIGKSERFKRSYNLNIDLAIYSAILYIIDFSGVAGKLGFALTVFNIICCLGALYSSYLIIMGIIEIERKDSVYLRSSDLKSSWTLVAIFQLASYFSVVFPVIAIVLLVSSSIFSIWFLHNFNSTKRLYENYFNVLQAENSGVN